MHIKTVGSYEAKTHLPALLDAVEQGEKIIITRRGIPVAIISPYNYAKPNPKDTIQNILHASKGHSLKGLSVSDMKKEGRRF